MIVYLMHLVLAADGCLEIEFVVLVVAADWRLRSPSANLVPVLWSAGGYHCSTHVAADTGSATGYLVCVYR